MTTQILPSRNQKAQAEIEGLVRNELTSPPPKMITVSAEDNHSGEPSLYVYVVMPSAQDIPAEPQQNRLVVRMIQALEKIDDPRFPYLNFGPQEPGANSNSAPADEDV